MVTLHNYTVAKDTIQVDFELDSLFHDYFEIEKLDTNENKLRVFSSQLHTTVGKL